MILELRVENVKRIKAAHIHPPAGTVTVGGRNAQGKSSVLDSIAMALGGKREIPDRPIRDGTERAEVEVVLDNGLRITRTMTVGGERLVVQSADGARYPSPQSMLDAMLGSACLDPVRFVRAGRKEQSRLLREAAKLDLTEIDREIAEREVIRRDAARAHKAAESACQACPVPEHVPDAVDVTALVARRDAAAKAKRERDAAESSLASYRHDIDELRQEIEEMRHKIEANEREIKDYEKYIERTEARLAEPFDDALVAKIDAEISTHKQVEAERALAARALSLRQDLILREKASLQASQGLDQARAKRDAAIRHARWPVEGLSLRDDGEVLYRGLPLDQASSAELVRLSCELALSGCPELRVLLVREGALLDSESLEAMREVATRYDAQVWIERVGTDESCSVVIEDGKVV